VAHVLGNHAFDDGLFLDANEFARDTGWLHGAAKAYASYGVVLFAVLLLAGWWVSRPRGARATAAALWAGGGTLLAVLVNQPLVHHFHEARPYTAHHHLLVLASRSADYSFPSDHATMAGAVTAGLFLVSRRLGVIAMVAAFAMAATRVYIAAHYPHDVVAGLVLGAVVSLLGWWALARPLTWAVERLSRSPLRPLVSAQAGSVAG
jgi:undecaprenyl-diphosphatase